MEHDPEDIWRSVLDTGREALLKSDSRASDLAGVGIANQRETTLVWNRRTGKPIHNAIVWQDRRTAPQCAKLKAQGLESMVSERTGLLLDPYFSATKIALAARQCRERARACRAGRACLRHGRQLPHLAIDRRPDARHRRHQRLAHAAAQHSFGPMGRRASEAVSGAARHDAGSSRLRSGFWGRPKRSTSAWRCRSAALPGISRRP